MEATIHELISSVIIWVGVLLMVISGIGIIRFPDFYIRMSAITKAATLGVGLIVVGITVYFNDVGIAIKAVFIIAFLLITSPIAAHIIAREAYEEKTPFWEKTSIDEFRQQLRDREAQARFSDIDEHEKK